MRWEKKGLIYVPDGEVDWSKTHAQIPTPLQLNEKILRIYFGTRDAYCRTQISHVDLDIKNPLNIIERAKKPDIAIGFPGLHDDCGAMPFCVFKDKHQFKFYYTGWHIPTTVSYDLSIALATSDDLLNFNKYSKGPLISKNIYEAYWAAAPYVMYDGKYKMWYISCYDWVRVNNTLEPVYNIKYAESIDSINWNLTHNVAIKPKSNNEALGRPWVIKENGLYKMWYSYRGSKNYRNRNGEHYKIGYAESTNGIDWTRKDASIGLDVSESGWDSEMIEYASIFQFKDTKYMFYNGNGFGKSGFGLAVSKD